MKNLHSYPIHRAILLFLAGIFLGGFTPGRAATALIDFGTLNGATTLSGTNTVWNTYGGVVSPANTNIPANTSVNLVDSTGAAFGTLTSNDANFQNGASPGYGGGVIGIYPASATSDYIGLDLAPNTVTPISSTFTLSGLDTTGTVSYSFTFLSSRSNAGGGPRTVDLTFTGANSGDSGSITANSDQPNGNATLTTVSGIFATSGGIITITASNSTANTFAYLNLMEINSTPEPSTVVLSIMGGLGLLFLKIYRHRRSQV